MNLKKLTIVFASIGYLGHALAQNPVSSFSVQTPACQSENVLLTNNSSDAVDFIWDFCHDGLENITNVSSTTDISTVSNPEGLELVYHLGNWYGFTFSRASSILYRLNFGSSLDNSPSITNLGNPLNSLTGPSQIRIVEEGGIWYGIVINFGISSMIRLSFGTDLTATPSAFTNFGNIGFNSPRGMELIWDGSQWIALVTNSAGNTISVVNIGNSITNNPTASEVTIIGSGAGLNTPFGIDVSQDNAGWYGFVTSFSNSKLYHLNFGSSLLNTPTFTEVGTVSVATDVQIIKDGNNFFVTAIGLNGVYQISMGTELAWIPSKTLNSLGNFSGILNNLFTFRIGRQDTDYRMVGLSKANTQLTLATFEDQCAFVSDLSSINETPIEITYNLNGDYAIDLIAIASNGDRSISSENIVITNNTAPQIDFSTINECVNVVNNFTSNYSGQLNPPNHFWDFDDDGMADQNTVDTDFTYTTPGNYPVSLTIDNGTCTNFLRDTVDIYEVPPSPSFTVDTSPACTNGEITFTNNTFETNHIGATFTYSWDFNGEAFSNSTTGRHTFATPGSKNVVLNMSIPGCSTNSSEPPVDIFEGPTPNFFIDENYCFNISTPVQFTNSSTISSGSITGYNWEFGDAASGTDTVIDPTYQYSNSGEYNVSLTVTSDNLCENTLQNTVRVDGTPIASFIAGLACVNTETAFEDNSLPGDIFNNINSRTWRVNGDILSTEEDPNLVIDQTGDVEISLTVTNDAGCDATNLKTVHVNPSPVVAFDIDANCVNQSTTFNNNTTTQPENPVVSTFWEIAGEVYVNENPSILFTQTGEYTASLTATSLNGCGLIVSEQFVISGIPDVSIAESSNCEGALTILSGITDTSTAVASRVWTFEGNEIGTQDTVQYKFPGAGEYLIQLDIEDQSGCSGMGQKTITIHPSPTATIETETNVGPPPLNVSFSSGSNATSYLWNFGDSSSTPSTDQNAQHVYEEFGNYQATLVVTDALGCSDTAFVEIAAVEPIFDVEIIEAKNSDNGDRISHSLVVQNNSTQSITDFDIKIDLDGQASIFESFSETIDRDTSIELPLNFSLASASNNVELACFTIVVSDDMFIDDLPLNNEGCISYNQQLVIETPYPNPLKSSSTTLTFQMVLPAKSPVQVFLADNIGSIVFDQIYVDVESGLNSFLIDVQSFQRGMYFLKVVYDGNSTSQKIIKM